ncbi:TonB family protein [bacterium]|nr:TonB family protein [bacterium]
MHALLFWALASADDFLKVEFAVRSGQALPAVSANRRARSSPVMLDSRITAEETPTVTFPAPALPKIAESQSPPPNPLAVDDRYVATPPIEEILRRRSERSMELAELPDAPRQAVPRHENTPEVQGRPNKPLWTAMPAPESPPVRLERPDLSPPTRNIAQTEVLEPDDAERSTVGAQTPQGAKVDALPKPLPTNREPVYPEELRRRQIEGRVTLKVTIDQEGIVERAVIEISSGEPLLDQSALTAIRAWRFEPARLGTRAVKFDVRIPVNFTIRR